MEKSTSKDFDLVSSIMGCFMFILASLMKPVTAIKNKINDYSDVKTTGILVVVIAFCRMIINLLGTMISTIEDFSSETMKTRRRWHIFKLLEG